MDELIDVAGAHANLDDALLPDDVRRLIEDQWWRPIEVQSSLEVVRHLDDFIHAPVDHPALFADHGVVHVRDIAANAVDLAATANGLLLARRPPDRQQFMTAVAVLTAYLHDVGMVDPTPTGRRIHALVAAQLPFESEADEVIERLMSRPGTILGRLETVDAAAPFDVPLDVIMRELMSLTIAHSKSTVPIETFAQPECLRRLVQACVFTSLDEHRQSPRTPTVPASDSEISFDVNIDCYDDPRRSYGWMVSDATAHRALVHDVIDGLRVLRAADALRQRGTSLRTASGYEIFIDGATGHAVYALREPHNTGVHLLRVESAIAAGEANLRAAAVTADGHLRIALHRGAFEDEVASQRAADGTAAVIADIALDVLPTFADVATGELLAPVRHDAVMQLLVERPSDNAGFADEVARLVMLRRPDLIGRIAAVAGIAEADVDEQDRYLRAAVIRPDSELAALVIAGAAERGANVRELDPQRAFADVRLASVTAGEVVVADGSPSAFVYLADAAGLWVHPLGGYAPEAVPAWFALGVTGAVRRAHRNSAVIAHAELDVVMIPTEVYLREWFRPIAASELPEVLRMARQR